MPFEAKIERVTMESEWENLLEHGFKTEPYASIQSNLRQESMLQHKTLVELRTQTEARAEIAYGHMICTQPESLVHNLLSFNNDSSKDTQSQREQAMLCGHFSQVPTPVNYFPQESGEMCAEANGDLDDVWYYIRKGYMDKAKICITEFFTQQDLEPDQLHHEIATVCSKQDQKSPG